MTLKCFVEEVEQIVNIINEISDEKIEDILLVEINAKTIS
jgi:ABC-type branched-subunit amino acid transport system ATPase component